MKGITPVIAIILLIMITISMAAFMFVWFTDFLEILTNQTGGQLTHQQRLMQMGITIIESHKDSGTGNIFVTLRNSGTVTIEAGELAIFAKNSTGSIGSTYMYQNPIAPGAILSDLDTGIPCPADSEELEIKADVLGTNDDSIHLACS